MSKPYKLIKCSLPDDWEKDYSTLDETIDELRKHICGGCLSGGTDWYAAPCDVVINGRVIECRDPRSLLGTPCGCEYEIEGDLGFWEHVS